MDTFGVFNSLSVISNWGIAIFLFIKGKKMVNMLIACVALTLSIWSLACSFFTNIPKGDYDLALFWFQFGYTGVILIPVFYFHFVVRYLHLKRKFILFCIYVFSIIFVFLNWYDHSILFLGSINFILNRFFWVDWVTQKSGFYLLFFVLFYGATLTYAFMLLLIRYFKEKSALQKNQLRYFIIGSIIGWIGGELQFTPVFRTYNIFGNDLLYILLIIGAIFTAIYPFIIAYGILKYRLMDINVALTRAGIFIVVYTLVLGIPFFLGYRYGIWQIATWITVVLATMGPFIYQYLRRHAEARLLAEDYRKYDILKRFTATLGRMKDIGIEKLLKLIIYRLVKTMDISCGAIYLNDEEEKACIWKAAHTLKDKQSIAVINLSQEGDLIRFIIAYRKEFLQEDVYRLLSEESPRNKQFVNNQQGQDGNTVSDINYSEVINQMQQLNARLIIPNFMDQELIGFLVLGEKVSGRPYSVADIEVLVTLFRQSSLAILNALFAVRLKDSERELANSSRIVEIGNLASSTGHQMGNVLNNIMNAGYAALDNDTIINTLKAIPEAKAAFEKIIDVIITNASDGDLIIDEIRSYSRQDEDKQYVLVNLKDVLDKTLRMLYIQINKFQNIDISINIAPDVPQVLASPVGLQNIFVNMFNNAYDSIQEMKQLSKPSYDSDNNNYKGKIEVNITCAKGIINIYFIDNGKGMTPDIARKLFSPHYTTKGSSDKRKEMKLNGGTGIGLFTIRFLVMEYGGTVRLVKTGHLEGADFLIQLPVPK